MARPRKQYTNEELINELKRVAWLLHKDTVSRTEMDKHGTIDTTTYRCYFGNWTNAVLAAGLSPIAKNNKGHPNPRRTPPSIHKREYVTHEKMVAVFKRDYHKCVLCDASPATDKTIELHIDHVLPVALGGSSKYWNLWVLCAACNLKKGAKLTTEMRNTAWQYLGTRFFDKELEAQ